MEKVYLFKRLTGQVKRLAALMLIVLMAVGNVFADEMTYVFSEAGFSNSQDLTLLPSIPINNYLSFTASKGGSSTTPKYFTSGAAVRFYAASGNGNSFTITPADGYKITGVTVTETGGNNNIGDIGFIVDGGMAVVVSPENKICSITDVNAVNNLTFYNAVNSSSGHIRIASITITYSATEAPAVAAPEFSIPAGTYYTPQKVALTTEAEDANIYYSINGGEPVLYTDSITVSTTSTISAYTVQGENTSSTVTAHYQFPVFLNTIADFYAADNASLFMITGDVTFVYRNGRYMYVKDQTGGLLVFDNNTSVITTQYNEGDVISGGLIGTRTIYNGLYELIPTENTAIGVAGEAIAPIEVTAAELLANRNAYVSQKVIVKDGQFAAGSFNTSSVKNINFTQNGNKLVVRNAFKTVSKTFSANERATVIGFVTIYNNDIQLFPRDNDDIISLDLTVPFNCDFESNNKYVWNLANGENANNWFIGQAQGFDDNKLYISSSDGVTNNYNVNTAAVSHAYATVTLPAEDVMLTFDCRTVGNANDYLQVSVLDEAPVAGTQPETYLARIYGVNDFTTQTVLIPASYAGAKNLVFTWVNDIANGAQTPAAIDNVVLKNTYTVNATVSNYYETEYNNNAIGATYAPSHDVVGHGDAHTGIITVANHYHINAVTVNGLDVTSSLVSIGNHQYKLTLDPVYENKNVNVVVGLDSAYVFIYVLDGEGTINNELVVNSETELPAMYNVTLPGYSSLPCTFVPAQGYHVSSLIIDNVEYPNVESYNFEHLFGNHLVLVTFAPNHYVVSTVAYGNGEVSDGEEFDYDADNTYIFTATPAAGYRIATLMRNNVLVDVPNPAVGYTETLTNILQNYNYEVMFEQNTYSVTASCGANGTISPNGVSNYNYHQNAEVVITADYGYYISSVTKDGLALELPDNDMITTLTIPFLNIEANHTISATFAEITYNVTVNAGTHGTIAPGTDSFAYGATPTFTITPDLGYSIADVTVDGVSVGAVSQYTFLPLNGNHTIAATFAAVTFTITATAGNGGTISNAGVSQVAYNGNKTYTITANTGYHVSDVVVDGASVGVVNTYAFTDVTADHSIYAEFAVNEYTVSVVSQPNVTVNPGTLTVQHGATPVFAIIPDYGYRVSQIQVNGTNVNLSNVPNENEVYTYTFAAVTANQTIKAVAERKTYTITANAGNNGTITPNGSTTVNHGDAKSFAFAPADGYVIENVTVDGMSLGALTAYTFTNVVANHSINVTFKPVECVAPYSLYTTHIDSTSAMVHWSHPIATSFNIQYKTLNGTWTSISNMPGNSYLLTDLEPNTTYLWQVRANCSSSNLSDWSGKISFKTLHTLDITGIEDLVKSQVKVYGEHQNVHILNNEGVNIENVRIFDAYGRLIYSGVVGSENEVIGLNVATGTYIVNVATENGTANYKVVLMK